LLTASGLRSDGRLIVNGLGCIERNLFEGSSNAGDQI
jgi:hypothetical protein